MKGLYAVVVALAFVGLRLWRRRGGAPAARSRPPWWPQRGEGPGPLGDVGLIAAREVRERVRGRIFRFGTAAMLVAVGAAIVLPTLDQGSSTLTDQRVGVVGRLSPPQLEALHAAASRSQVALTVVDVASPSAARAAIRAETLDLAIVDGRELLVDELPSTKGSPADASFVEALAANLGALEAFEKAGLSPAQAAEVARARPLPTVAVEGGGRRTVRASSIIGLVLVFFMLTQYDTWILTGVMQEKSSRVVEVLLATVRPLELLGGKVLGIGMVALAQAGLVTGFALIVAEAVGSNVLSGTAPVVLLAQLVWLLLGYAFYCWVYAAAGSTAERQDQVQTLALPLSLPILLGYIFAITVASSGHPDPLFEVLAYLPLTAPFCMPVLVALNLVSWWQFLAAVVVSAASTVAMAVAAARIYRRAVLRTGARVRLRDLSVRRGAPGRRAPSTRRV